MNWSFVSSDLVSATSFLAFLVNYTFHFGSDTTKLHNFMHMKVCINISLISEVNFRLRKSYETL